MTVPVVQIEDYEPLMFAVGPPPGLETLGQAELDTDGRRWKVTVDDRITWHTSKLDAKRELHFRAGRLVGSPS